MGNMKNRYPFWYSSSFPVSTAPSLVSVTREHLRSKQGLFAAVAKADTGYLGATTRACQRPWRRQTYRTRPPPNSSFRRETLEEEKSKNMLMMFRTRAFLSARERYHVGCAVTNYRGRRTPANFLYYHCRISSTPAPSRWTPPIIHPNHIRVRLCLNLGWMIRCEIAQHTTCQDDIISVKITAFRAYQSAVLMNCCARYQKKIASLNPQQENFQSVPGLKSVSHSRSVPPLSLLLFVVFVLPSVLWYAKKLFMMWFNLTHDHFVVKRHWTMSLFFILILNFKYEVPYINTP